MSLLEKYHNNFKNNLFCLNSVEAIKYLKKRNISWDIITKFDIGYTGTDFYNEDLPWFDNCITIPALSVNGEIVGMFSRKIGNISPKSPISKNYNKDTAIFGLYQAKESIISMGYAILAEGIFDVLSMHQLGFTNTIASPGISFTDIQMGLLFRFTNNVVILFDNDNPGLRGSLKLEKDLKDLGMITRNLRLYNYKDIDEFIVNDRNLAKNYLDLHLNNSKVMIK